MASLYRKKALQNLSSPEQLDRMVVITPPMIWLAIAAGFVLTVAVAIWAGAGSVYSTSSCRALYFDRGQVEFYYAPAEGMITACHVPDEEIFHEGDVLFELQDDSGQTVAVTARADGYAQSFLHAGRYVNKGAELLRCWEEDDSREGYVICTLPFSLAGSVREGQKVLLYPTYLDDQYYGHMTGVVESVGTEPVSKEKLYAQTGNEALVEKVLQDGPCVAVRCRPDPDPDSENGYYWTNPNGRSVRLANETMITAEIIVSKASPLSLLAH